MNKIFKNFLYILSGSIIEKILSFVFLMVVARYYGEEVFGSYNFAKSIVSYFIMISTMGIQSYAVLLISKEPQNSHKIYREIVSVELVLSAISSILLIIFTIFFPINRIMILLVGTTIVIQSLNTDWFFRAKQELSYVSYSTIMSSILQCVLIFGLINSNNRNVYFLPIVVSVSYLIPYSYLIIISKNKFKLNLFFVKGDVLYYIRNGIPFFFSGVFAAINGNIDIIILGFMKTNKEVGLYSAAYGIINTLVLFVSIIFAPIYPSLVEAISQNRLEKVDKLISTVSKVLLIFIVPITIGGIAVSNNLISLVFGKNYEGVTQTFCILLLFTFVLYFREIYGYILSTSGNQKTYMYIVCLSSIVNISFNFLLIPKIGINGAALATLLSEVINLILMGILAHKKVVFHIDNLPFFKVFLSSLIMGSVTYYFNTMNINVLITILIGIIIYILLIILFKVVTKEEFSNLVHFNKVN